MNVLNLMRNVLQINNIVVVDGFLQLTDERNARRLQLQGQNAQQFLQERMQEERRRHEIEQLRPIDEQRRQQRRERRELREALRRDIQQRREQRIQRKQEQEEQRRQREEQRRQREEQRRQRKQAKQPIPVIPREEVALNLPIIPPREDVAPNFPIIPAPNLHIPIVRLGPPLRVIRCGICRLEGHNARNRNFHPI
jgi:hypothetical protein